MFAAETLGARGGGAARYRARVHLASAVSDAMCFFGRFQECANDVADYLGSCCSGNLFVFFKTASFQEFANDVIDGPSGFAIWEPPWGLLAAR